MKLRKHQSEFALDFAKLIIFAYKQAYELTINEVLRPQEMQDIYVAQGKSWTNKSQHRLKLAGDLNLFKDNKYLATTKAHKELGIYWESLSPYNVWGGRFRDGNHYERRHDTTRKKRLNGKYKKSL